MSVGEKWPEACRQQLQLWVPCRLQALVELLQVVRKAGTAF